MRRWSLLANCFGLAAAVLVTGCRPRTTPAEAAIARQTLLLGNAAEPADLDPPVATAYTDMNILMSLFEGLTFIDEQTAQPIPAASERWETSADGLTWTFHLRADAKWSNGDAVTADDFVQSFRRVVSPKMALENASYLFALKNAEAINGGKIADATTLGASAPDPHTLVLTLERPTPHLALLTALTPWFPINPRVLAQFDALQSRGTKWTRPGNLVGNGPFVLSDWQPNTRIVVKKNPQYWDAAATKLAAIEFIPIEHADAEELSFRAGQLHVTDSLPLSKIASWRARDPNRLRVDPFLQTVFVEFNTTRAPFDDPRVREALSLAIDRTTLARTALGGSYAPAFAATPPATGGYTAEAHAGYDPERARALLAAAGYPNGAKLPEFPFQIRNDERQAVVAEALQAMWQRNLGIRVSIQPMEQKTWLQNQGTLNYTISTFSWVADFPDPLTFLGLFVSTNGNNWTAWKDATFDKLIDAASTTTVTAARRELYQQAEARLLEAAPVAPIYHGAKTYLIHPAVKNWVPAPLGFRRYQRVWLE